MVAILNLVIRMIDYKSIGRRIAFYRKKAAMTQSALSEKLGVSESYISQIERGSARASLSRLAEISECLQIDIALLVSDRVAVSQDPVHTEIFEIIKDWSAEQVSFLADMLICANEKMREPKK